MLEVRSMRRLIRGLRGLRYWICGHIIAALFYDKKYIKGRWFDGSMKGLCAIGWEWVTHDFFARMHSCDNLEARFPINQKCKVINPSNIVFDPNDLNNFHSYGIYYQAIGKITIGKGTYIAPNVGIITANHNVNDLEKHCEAKDVIIGKQCWIGMNSVILPGVTLGDKTIVGAGSVVTKSFPNGSCVVAGNPAKVIKSIKEESINE